MQRDSASHQGVPRLSTSARTKLLVSLGAAIVGGAAAAAAGAGRSAPLIGWDILAVVFCAWVWSTVWRLDAKSTASHAQSENPGRDLADVILLAAAVASLIAVGVVLFGAGHANGNLKYLQAGFALVSVFVSWTLVHTVFTLKYARLYYSGRAAGIDFNEADPPAVQRLRLPVLHDRHDVPGLGHQHRIQADPTHGIAPRLAVVSAGGGHHLSVHQPRSRPGEMTRPVSILTGPQAPQGNARTTRLRPDRRRAAGSGQGRRASGSAGVTPHAIETSVTQAGVAPSSACVCGSRPQRQTPSHDQDETAAANLLRESSRPSRGTRGKVTFSRIALSVTLLQS